MMRSYKEIRMRNKIKHILCAGVIGALMAGGAMADVSSKRITFARPVTVNGATIAPGRYTVRFDSEKKELSVHGYHKVVASATAHIEKLANKVRGTRVTTAPTSNGYALISVTFNGKNERIVLDSGRSDSPSMQ
jgi:hypothetical protein